MVERINILRNIGQFDSVSPNQQTTALSKLALIYAENGRGKTTLANILRSLATNNPILITERHRLGAQNMPHVVINANNQIYTFQNGAWSSHLADIAVFDDHFVDQNVCSGVAIESGHKQNLHELILGAQGVALNATLQGHIAKIEEHNRQLKIKEAAIPATERKTLSADAFCGLPAKKNIDQEIQEAERNLAAAQAADAIKKHAVFLAFELPEFDPDSINTVLESDLPGLQASATVSVQQHLVKLGKGSEAWVSEGMQKIQEDACPFCAQNLQQSSMIEHYKAYFSTEYSTLKQTITDCGKSIAAAHSAEIQSAFERSVLQATQGRDFWKNFVTVPEITVDTAEIARAWKAAREPILAILRDKFSSPLEKMTLPQDVLTALENYNSHKNTIMALSQSLLTCNAQIDAVKEKAAAANVATLSADLEKLKMTKARHSATVAPLCKAYLDEKSEKKKTEGQRDAARQTLDQYRTNIFGQYETAINTYLGKFNAGFRLSSVSVQNNRAGSSCNYNVLINNVTVPLTANDGQPSFKNTLSAGDRNALALAFFFASLDQDQKLAQKIVVIDDPMTSLDEHRSLATIQEMRNLSTRVSQVIILSHSKPFLCHIWEGADKATRSAIKIIRSGQSSAIEPWDVHQDCITEHDKRHALIQKHINNGSAGQERNVATALRYVLEAFLRVAYPENFPPGKLLGGFYGECNTAIQNNAPILSQTDTAELKALMDYANKFHHDTNPAYATVSINDTELTNFCQRTLQFARRS
jgi:wobble nucleotide-excising tRNase